ncbi:MAG TPA: hypothetical protein PK445_01760 [Methanolinea sp.]|nr:hypothetical protein [Methanolinea sp.]
MDLPSDRRIAPILPLVLLVVPLNLYVIGDWLGTGVQWALFRYQETSYGPSLITIASDIGYVISGLITGRTAISFILWDAGAVILVVSFLVLLLAVAEGKVQWMRYAGVAVAASGVLLVASCIAQYGPLLAGPAGFSVPLGVPLVFAIAWVLYAGEWSEGDDGDGEDSG